MLRRVRSLLVAGLLLASISLVIGGCGAGSNLAPTQDESAFPQKGAGGQTVPPMSKQRQDKKGD